MKRNIALFVILCSLSVGILYYLSTSSQAVEGNYVNVGDERLELILDKDGNYTYLLGSKVINKNTYTVIKSSVQFTRWIDHPNTLFSCEGDIGCRISYTYDGCCSLIISEDAPEMNFVRKAEQEQ